MDDVQFMALAEALIRYVREKFGLVAAWAAAMILVVVPFVLFIGFLIWVMS